MNDTVQKAAREIEETYANWFINCETQSGEIQEDVKAIIQRCIDEANAWQPIETAPKDGTPILLNTQDCDEPIIGRFVRNYWVQGNYSLVTIDSNVNECFWKWTPVPNVKEDV